MTGRLRINILRVLERCDGELAGMPAIRAPLELGDGASPTDAIELPDWARHVPRALWLALASVLIPGYASRWL
jgi:hypothetical protein